MKILDCVELIAERTEYTSCGIYKGMQGWICLEESSDGTWLVNFPKCTNQKREAKIPIFEADLKLLPNGFYGKMREEIKQELIQKSKMQYMDCVEVIAEKPKYTRYGVHKGMQGWICLEESLGGTWLVNFPGYGENADLAEAAISEEDLKVIPIMNSKISEKIKAEFDRKQN